MVKATGNIPGVPKKTDEDVNSSSLNFNPVNLRLVAEALRLTSGLTYKNIFESEEDRLTTTVCWALSRLALLYEESDEQGELKSLREQFKAVIEGLRKYYTVEV